MKELNIRQCLDLILGNMKVGDEIGGLQLQREVAKLNPKYTFTYPDTILREMRRLWRKEIICSNRQRSLYKKIKEKEL